MRALLYRVWKDIKRGENIDFYLTIAVSFGLVFLSLIGVNISGQIAPITLAVLGLLAISALRNHYFIEELGDKITKSTGDRFEFSDEFPDNLAHDIEKASEIWLSGVTLRILDSNFLQFEKALRNGCKLKVLLVDPFGFASDMAAMRSYSQPGDANRTKVRIQNTLADFCHLHDLTQGDVEIRTVDFPLGHRLIAINPELVSGTLYIANYPFRVSGGSRPKFVIDATDGKWYDFYKEEFNLLWNSGTNWQCLK